jgi:hypothetical protein
LAFDWSDYEEVWQRTERLLQRAPKKSGIVKNVDVDMSNAAQWDESWDGFSDE